MINEPLTPISILVAEDVESTRRIVQRFLETIGYAADIVKDGIEAVESFKSKHYDLVMMDLQMPGMDGITAVDKIKEYIASQGTQYPYFVAQTNVIRESDEERYQAVGFDKAMFKPVNLEKLRYCIELAIQRKIYVQNLPHKLNRQFAEQNPLKILVCDDERINGLVTLKQLNALGYESHYVSSGYDAIESIEHEHYDAILMDIRMPEFDGFATTDTIREIFYQRKTNKIPSIIALTTIEMLQSKTYYREGMFENHLVKPLQIEKLAHALHIASQRAQILGVSDTENTSAAEQKTNP